MTSNVVVAISAWHGLRRVKAGWTTWVLCVCASSVCLRDKKARVVYFPGRGEAAQRRRSSLARDGARLLRARTPPLVLAGAFAVALPQRERERESGDSLERLSLLLGACGLETRFSQGRADAAAATEPPLVRRDAVAVARGRLRNHRRRILLLRHPPPLRNARPRPPPPILSVNSHARRKRDCALSIDPRQRSTSSLSLESRRTEKRRVGRRRARDGRRLTGPLRRSRRGERAATASFPTHGGLSFSSGDREAAPVCARCVEKEENNAPLSCRRRRRRTGRCGKAPAPLVKKEGLIIPQSFSFSFSPVAAAGSRAPARSLVCLVSAVS